MEEVCRLPNGYTLYREENEAGGHRYYSDEVGAGCYVWDTCLVHPTTLLAVLVEEYRRDVREQHENKSSSERVGETNESDEEGL